MSKMRIWGALVLVVVVAAAAVYFGILRGRGSRASNGAPGSAATPVSFSAASSLSGMSADEKEQAYTTEVEALHARVTRLQAFLDRFPAALTDVGALAQTLATPQAAFEFVRDQIAFEPYPGIMKGARGTLITRGGNSLDRALLLAAILKQKGVAVGIAHGRLSPDQAQSLLQQVARTPGSLERMLASLTIGARSADLTAHQREIGDAATQRAGLASNAVGDAVTREYAALHASVKNSALARAAQVPNRQIDSVADHYWVQATIDDQAVALDPSVTTATVNQKLTDATDTLDPDSLADQLFQRVRFRIVGDFLDNGRVQSTELLSQEYKATDLFSKNIRVGLGPLTPGADERRCEALLLVGDDRTTGREFRLSGQASDDQGAAGGGSPDIGASSGIGGLMGGLGGGEEKPAPKKQPTARPAGGGALGRLYLEVTSSGPHLEDARYRRVIMDRLETVGATVRLQPALADDQAVRALMMQAWDGAVSVGSNNVAFMLAVQLEALKAREAMEAKARARFYRGESFGVGDLAAPILSPELVNYYFSSDVTRFHLNGQGMAGARSYYERPRLAFFRHGFVVGDWSQPQGGHRFAEGIDLLNAPFQFVGKAEDAQRLAVEAGIADTALEREMVGEARSFNTLSLLAAAASQKVAMVILGPGQPARLDAVTVPPAIRSVLQAEIAEGRTLVLPARLVTLNDVQTYGWWSIDPETGVALGKMELGGAQGLVESSQINEKITKWTEILTKFYGGLLQCYMKALGENLGAFEAVQKLEAPHGQPGENPMPVMDQLAECVIKQTCDAIADILTEAAVTPAFEHEAEALVKPLRKIILEWAAEKAATEASKKGFGAACEAAGGAKD